MWSKQQSALCFMGTLNNPGYSLQHHQALYGRVPSPALNFMSLLCKPLQIMYQHVTWSPIRRPAASKCVPGFLWLPVRTLVCFFCSACLNDYVLYLKSHSAVLFINLGRGAVHISSLTPHVFWLSLLTPARLGRWDANVAALICMFTGKEMEEKEKVIHYV